MNIRNELIKRSPTLLLGAGILGFVTATVMAARAAPKANRALDQQEDEYFDLYFPENEVPLIEKVKVAAPHYLPTVGLMLVSTGLLLSSNRIVRKRYTSLLALYTITERALSEWEASTAENVTPKKLDKIRERVLAPTADPPEGEDEFVDGRSVYYDQWSGRYFWAPSVDTIRRAIAEINLRLVKEDFVPLNDFYYALGMDPVEMGDDIGWSVNGEEAEVYFDSMLRNDRPYVKVIFRVAPREW